MKNGIGQLDFDVPLLAGLHAFGQVEVQRVTLADAGQGILERRGIIHRHAIPPERRAISEVPAD